MPNVEGRFRPSAYRLLYYAACPLEGLQPQRDFEPEHLGIEAYYHTLVKLARQYYGPLAPTIFHTWGVTSNADIVRALHHLVDEGLMIIDPKDRLEEIDELLPITDLLRARSMPKSVRKRNE